MSTVVLQVASHADELPSGYGLALLQALLALVGVCVLAWVVLRWAATRARLPARGRTIRVLERVSLEPRRSLYLVEVADRVFLVGAGEGGAIHMLAEIERDQLPAIEEPPRSSFADMLRAKLRAKDQ